MIIFYRWIENDRLTREESTTQYGIADLIKKTKNNKKLILARIKGKEYKSENVYEIQGILIYYNDRKRIQQYVKLKKIFAVLWDNFGFLPFSKSLSKERYASFIDMIKDKIVAFRIMSPHSAIYKNKGDIKVFKYHHTIDEIYHYKFALLDIKSETGNYEERDVKLYKDYYKYTKNSINYYKIDFGLLPISYTLTEIEEALEKSNYILSTCFNCGETSYIFNDKNNLYYYCPRCSNLFEHTIINNEEEEFSITIGGKHYVIKYKDNQGVYLYNKRGIVNLGYFVIKIRKLVENIYLDRKLFGIEIDYKGLAGWEHYKIENQNNLETAFTRFLKEKGIFSSTKLHKAYLEMFPYLVLNADKEIRYDFEGYMNDEWYFKGIKLNNFEAHQKYLNDYIFSVNEIIRQIPIFSFLFLLSLLPFYIKFLQDNKYISSLFNIINFLYAPSGTGKSWLINLLSKMYYIKKPLLNIRNSTINHIISILKDRSNCPSFDDEILRGITYDNFSKSELKQILAMIMLEESRGRNDITGRARDTYPFKNMSLMFFSENKVDIDLLGEVEGNLKRIQIFGLPKDKFLTQEEFLLNRSKLEEHKNIAIANHIHFLKSFLDGLERHKVKIAQYKERLIQKEIDKKNPIKDLRLLDYYVAILTLSELLKKVFHDFDEEVIKDYAKMILEKTKTFKVMYSIVADIIFKTENYLVIETDGTNLVVNGFSKTPNEVKSMLYERKDKIGLLLVNDRLNRMSMVIRLSNYRRFLRLYYAENYIAIENKTHLAFKKALNTEFKRREIYLNNLDSMVLNNIIYINKEEIKKLKDHIDPDNDKPFLNL